VLWWCLVAAAWAGKWTDTPSDVIVMRDIDAPTERIHPLVSDLRSLEGLLPADCATDWQHGARSRGVGARARLKYTIGPMRRTLSAVISKDQPAVVEIDHEGNKGFVTQWQLAELDGGTRVTLGTYLMPPPWPFKGVYFKKVMPAWEDCYERTLDALEARAEGS
jgi:hypothetical protein